MIVLPFIQSELRMATRTSSIHWSRFGWGIAGTLMGLLLFMAIQAGGTIAGPSSLLLHFLFFILLFAGVRSTADGLGRERRAGTLGLLFFTGLKGYEIALGKAAAGGAKILYKALALIPGLVLVLLIVRMNFSQMTMVLLAMIATLFVAVSIGIFLSAFFREKKQSEGWAAAAAICIGWILPKISLVPGAWSRWDRALELSFMSTPAYLISHATAGHNRWTTEMALALGLNFLLGAFLLLVAGCRIARLWRKEMFFQPKRSWFGRLGTGFFRRWNRGPSFRDKLLAVNPVYWLLVRDRGGELRIWAFLVILPLLIFAFVRLTDSGQNLSEPLMASMVAFFLLGNILAAHQASRLSGELKSEGRLEFLSTTSLRTEEIMRGHQLSMRRCFTLPLVAFTTLSVGALGFLYFNPGSLPWSLSFAQILALMMAINLMLGANLASLGWVGLHNGLKMERPRDAASDSLLKILVLPLVLSLIALVQAATFISILVCWVSMGLLCAFTFGILSWRQVRVNFQEFALPGYYGERPGWGAWLGRQFRLLLARGNRPSRE